MTENNLPRYSALRKNDRPDLGTQLPLSMPLSIYLETTNNCNFKCVQCPVSFDDYYESNGGKANIEIQAYRKLVSQLCEMGRLKSLKFYSEGEPFMNKNIALMVKEAVDARVTERTEITTNASAFTEKNLTQVIEAGVDYIRVSIYSVKNKRHKEITQSKISVERIYDNVKLMRCIRDKINKGKPFIYVKMIDPKTNEVELFNQMYGSLADEVAIEQPINWNGYDGRDLINASYLDKQFEVGAPRKKVCPFAFYSLVIKANGDVVVCCADWNKKTKVGNIHQKHIRDIWNGTELHDFRLMQLEGRKHENASCVNCTYIDTTPDDLDHLKPEQFGSVLGRS